MQLHWKTNSDLSAMHVAWAVAHFGGRVRVGGELLSACESFATLASKYSVPASRFWELALVLSVDGGANFDWATRMSGKLLPQATRSDALLSEATAALAGLERAFKHEFSSYAREIELRQAPLKELWEAHGPGTLRQVGLVTSADVLVESAAIYLVQPVLGGSGFAHLATNRVHLEAVLTNRDPRLPETLRLAWLLAQLDAERPVHSELMNALEVRRVAGFAMIPAVLWAGQELGLCELSVASVQAAMEAWHAEFLSANQSNHAAALAAVVMTWWETYEAGQPEWRIAMAGLDRMLA